MSTTLLADIEAMLVARLRADEEYVRGGDYDFERERYARRVIGKNACDWLDIALTHLGHEAGDSSDRDRAEFWEVMAAVISGERDSARTEQIEAGNHREDRGDHAELIDRLLMLCEVCYCHPTCENCTVAKLAVAALSEPSR